MKHLLHVEKQLGWNDMNKFFTELGNLSEAEIEKARKGDDTDVNSEEEARKIFIHWRKIKGSEAKLQAILQALIDLENNLVKKKLEDKWTEGGRKGKLEILLSSWKYFIACLILIFIWLSPNVSG